MNLEGATFFFILFNLIISIPTTSKQKTKNKNKNKNKQTNKTDPNLGKNGASLSLHTIG